MGIIKGAPVRLGRDTYLHDVRRLVQVSIIITRGAKYSYACRDVVTDEYVHVTSAQIDDGEWVVTTPASDST